MSNRTKAKAAKLEVRRRMFDSMPSGKAKEKGYRRPGSRKK